jgi:hypothetical protein
LRQQARVSDVAAFENRQPETAAKFINKSSLFILLLGVIHRLELKPKSEQKAENIFVAPPYCQTACYGQFLFLTYLNSDLSFLADII